MRDAEHLADPRGAHPSLDQAYHLAGFAPECLRKSCLGMRWLDQAIGHRFDRDAEGVLEFALALDPLAHRYKLSDMGRRYPELAQWREDVRYLATGRLDPARMAAGVAEARAAVDEILFGLWTDGRLDEGCLR